MTDPTGSTGSTNPTGIRDDPTREPTAQVEAIVRYVAVHHLPGAPPVPEAGRDVAPPVARAVVDRSVQERITGSLVGALASGVLDLDPEARAELDRRHGLELSRSLLREERLWELTRALRAEAVEHLVIKGPAIAHLDEPDPSWRSFTDIDLLVRAEHLAQTVAVVDRTGADRHWTERRPGYDARFAKSVTLTTAGGIELDLHRSLCDGVHGFRIPLDRLFADPDHFDLAGEEIGALRPVHRLLHAAYHAVLGSPEPRLMSLRDLAGYLARPDIDRHEAVAEARLWRGEAVLAEAVRATGLAFGWLPDPWADWQRGVAVPGREARIIARQKVEGSSFGPAKLAALRELPWRDRPAYAFAVAVPSAEHLRSRRLRRIDLLRAFVPKGARGRP